MDNTEFNDEVENLNELDDLVRDDVEVNGEDTDELETEADLAARTIKKIRDMFDAGSTKSAIAKEVGVSRHDVIEVLGKYVGRNKINGKNTQTVNFEFSPEGKTRVELGDRLHSSIYVPHGKDIEAAKTKWLKVVNNE